MPRIPLPDPQSFTPAQQAVYEKVVAGRRGRLRGPLRAALYNPELADRWQALGSLLRYETSLPARLSELAILVTARACRSPFEWDAHRPEAEQAGLEPPIIEAILHDQTPPDMDPTTAAVHDFALELNRHRSASDATYARALAALGARGVVELGAVVGYYTLVAMTLNVHEIPLDDGVVPAFELPQHEALK